MVSFYVKGSDMQSRSWLNTYKKFNLEADVELPIDEVSLITLFDYNLKQHRNEIAFISMDKTMTYAELDEYSRRFAVYIQSLGLPLGSRIAVMMPNVLQYPIIMLGVIRAGMILVNINPLYTTFELEHQLIDSGADVLVVVDRFAHVYQPLHGKTNVRHVIVTGVGDLLGLFKGALVNFVLRRIRKEVPTWDFPYVNFKDALYKYSKHDYIAPELNAHHTALLQYTSATTGRAKGAELTHRNLIANILQVNALFESRFGQGAIFHGHNFFCSLPLYHIFSFTCMMYGMYVGARNILIPNPRDLDALIKEYRKYPPIIFPAVNTLFNALVNHPDFKNCDHSKLVGCIAGGMAVLHSTAERWQQVTGCMILEGYGLSETSPVATFNPPNNPNFTGTIGVPIPSTEVIILNDEGREVLPDTHGEICIRGPQVMKGYWNNPVETKKVLRSDGFLRTGDIGIMNAEGFIKLVDRKKDTIIVSGFNVYPNEVEQAISRHPKVLEVAVVGVPDMKSGEVPKAFIVKKDPSLTEAEIIEFTHLYLTGYKRPRHIEFRDELPKSNVGKILRKELRER